MRQCEVPNTICRRNLPKMKNLNLIKDLCLSDILGGNKRGKTFWMTLNGYNQQNSDYVKCSDFVRKKKILKGEIEMKGEYVWFKGHGCHFRKDGPYLDFI